MKTWLAAAAAFGSTMIGGLAAAQTVPDAAPPPVRAGGMMARVDANGDGVITRDEYLAGVDQRFDRLDLNHDGVLTPDEQPVRGHGWRGDAAPPPPAADGSSPPPPSPEAARRPMTRDEFRAGALRRFDRMDANHDGRIDQAELAALPRPGATRDGVPRNLPRPPVQ